jgi:hypothetical protein
MQLCNADIVLVLKVLKQLNLPPETPFSLEKEAIDRASRPWEILPAGHKIGTPEPLFKELVCLLFLSCFVNCHGP